MHMGNSKRKKKSDCMKKLLRVKKEVSHERERGEREKERERER